MLSRLLLLLVTLLALAACGGEVTLGSGRDGRARGGQTSVDGTDAGGAGGASDVGTPVGGAPVGGAPGVAGDAGRAGTGGGGGRGFAGGGGIAGTGGAAGSGAASGGGSGGATGKDPLVCEPPLAPMLDGPSAIHAPKSPLAGVAGDFDGDGRLDLATINVDGSIGVLIGNGNGTFRLGDMHDANLLPDDTYGLGRIATADLNGDDVLDLVALDAEQANLRVLLGKSNGRFDVPSPYTTGDRPVALAIEDWDRDGSPDLAYADSSGVRVVWNHGDGTFGAPSDAFDLPADPPDTVQALGAGDFDEDGNLDLALATFYGVSVLRGDGNRGFVPTSPLKVLTTAGSLSVGDFNHDQHLDVLTMIACARGADPSVSVLLGAGDATFALPTSYDARPCLTTSAVADVDRDGNLDVVAGPAVVMPGNDHGGFDTAMESTAPAGGAVLAVGDWNGDDQLDVAAVVDDLIAVHAGNGDGSFGAVPTVPGVRDVTSLALGDLDGNGTLDVATTALLWLADNASTQASLTLSFGVGDGTFGMVEIQDTPTGTAPAVQIADLNHDGQLDLVTMGDSSTSVGVLMGTGGGHFATRRDVTTGGAVWAGTIAELNGDDALDIVTLTQSPWSLSLLFGLGDGTFMPHTDIMLEHNPSRVAAGDVNGDRIPDLVVVGYNDAVVSVLAGVGRGGFAPPADYRIAKYGAAIALGDLNGDHALDIVTANYESMSILFGNGDGTFGARKDYTSLATELALVDFNADGKLDIVVGGSPPQIMLGAGDGTFPCSAFYGLGTYSESVAVGDLNHDGRLDLVASVEDLDVFLNLPH